MTADNLSESHASNLQPSATADCFEGTGLPRQFGRYILLRLLARGGMGQVFLASTTGVEGAERPVVIKVIRREHAKDPNFLARFLDEARVHAQLQHSGVAQVLEAAIHEPTGDPYVVIEYVEGKSLGDVRRRMTEVGTRLPWEDAVAVGALVAEALDYIHTRCGANGKPLRIVHRDLSPHNVMLGFGGDLKVIDFGTARGQNRRCHTVAGVVFAKPGYVAPEVANGDSGDLRVDLYALGVMVWELCSGTRFLRGEAADHLAAVAKGERELPPIAKRIGAPPELDSVLQQLTAFERDDRFSTSAKAATALARLLREAPALSNGERSIRARVAKFMYALYPDQPNALRRSFAKMVKAARDSAPEPWRPSLLEAAPVEEPENPSDLLAGTRYRIRRQLGAGGTGVVFEAEHVDLERRVAIKVLQPDHAHSPSFCARFRREARSLSRIHHPGIVKVKDFGQTSDGNFFTVMELLEGRSIADEMEREKRLSWRYALRIAEEACNALEVAHRAGLVHRDIKPGNLFLADDNDSVKLIDFGLAMHSDDLDEEPAANGGLTLFGTPAYMAPEQIAGVAVDHRADIYAMGCVMYEMLSGRLPFAEDAGVLVLDAKLKGSPEPLMMRVPKMGIPASVDRLVMKALSRHPSRRFSSAAEMAAAIREALEAPTRARRRRRTMGAAAATCLMMTGLALAGVQARPWLAQLPQHLPWMTEQVSPPSATTNKPRPTEPAQDEFESQSKPKPRQRVKKKKRQAGRDGQPSSKVARHPDEDR